MERYLYFRAQATIGNDDNYDDSACYPASSLMGMHPTNDTSLALFFKPMVRGVPGGNEHDDVTNFDNYDKVVLTIPNNTHLTAIKAIAEAANKSHSSLVVVADNNSSATEYLEGSGITSCASISMQLAYDNS
jgi:hypothetical protein|tara:strand:+ start:37 stop:432 length:396 start_codon:yes stop_codon:yes gene_type:complete